METEKCEACLTSDASQKVPIGDDGCHYKLCASCETRLNARALRPLEWYRLAAIHSPFTYLLHDDFYDQDGIAYQNEIPVKQSSLFPAPKIGAVLHDLDALLDYALTRWRIDDDLIAALTAYSSDELLPSLTYLQRARSIPWVNATCYEIAGSVLGPQAKEWLISQWDIGTEAATRSSFLRAVTKCTSDPAIVRRALDAVDKARKDDFTVAALALTGFKSPLVLEWVELRVTSPVGNTWGWVAACSDFSWDVAVKWLEIGRPLSLVALDALVNCLCPAMGNRPPGLTAELRKAPPHSAMVERLNQYAKEDDVPRVTSIVRRITQLGES